MVMPRDGTHSSRPARPLRFASRLNTAPQDPEMRLLSRLGDSCLPPGLGSRGFALGRVFLGHLGLGQKTKPRDGWCCSALGAALDTGSFSETPRLRDGADCVCPIQLYRARPASSSVDSIPFWDSSHLIRLMGRMSVLVSFKSSFVLRRPALRSRG